MKLGAASQNDAILDYRFLQGLTVLGYSSSYGELSWTRWDNLGLSGTIWDYMGLSGTISDYI